MRDHPRSRGEYQVVGVDAGFGEGSSPLSRGILDGIGGWLDALGIIPALAGNTPPAGGALRRSPDHPRSRGEYPACLLPPAPTLGSSPLSRGILRGCPHQRGHRGIIPALAGNTPAQPSGPVPGRDHPRSRGEYRTPLFASATSWGSSPLSRGIPLNELRAAGGDGIIPALAGNTSAAVYVAVNDRGSSPLSRGILYRQGPSRCQRRIIPALAGNTSRQARHGPPCQDHPRSRGEYYAILLDPTLFEGSSPLSRGIPARGQRWTPMERIIPALAGNTPRRRARRRGSGDHPRSRGEYERWWEQNGQGIGSSPLSRGIRGRRSAPPGGARIIPALAGNTDTP